MHRNRKIFKFNFRFHQLTFLDNLDPFGNFGPFSGHHPPDPWRHLRYDRSDKQVIVQAQGQSGANFLCNHFGDSHFVDCHVLLYDRVHTHPKWRYYLGQ